MAGEGVCAWAGGHALGATCGESEYPEGGMFLYITRSIASPDLVMPLRVVAHGHVFGSPILRVRTCQYRGGPNDASSYRASGQTVAAVAARAHRTRLRAAEVPLPILLLYCVDIIV